MIVYTILQCNEILAVCSNIEKAYEIVKKVLPDNYKIDYDWLCSMLRNQEWVIIDYYDEDGIDASIRIDMFELDKCYFRNGFNRCL